MICFSQPRYIKEIRDLLNKQGHTTQQSQLLANNKNSIFYQLIEREWIKEIPKNERDLILKDVKDGRAKRRQYYQSTLTPILNKIDQQVPLAKNERRQLKHLLEKQSFRQLFSWENGIRSFPLFVDFLGQYTLWIYIAIRYTEPYQLSEKDVSKIDKKKLLSEILDDINHRQNEIAKRISPKLVIETTQQKQEEFLSALYDSMDKFKPPLFNKLLLLSSNKSATFHMAISLLACGEFMSDFKKRKQK